MKKLLINAFLGAACLLSCVDASGMEALQAIRSDNVSELQSAISQKNIQLEDAEVFKSFVDNAVQAKSPRVLEYLVANDQIDYFKPEGRRFFDLLNLALRSGNVEILQLICNNYAEDIIPKMADQFGWDKLVVSVLCSNNESLIQFIADRGPNDFKGDFGYLWVMSRSNIKSDMMRLLCEDNLFNRLGLSNPKYIITMILIQISKLQDWQEIEDENGLNQSQSDRDKKEEDEKNTLLLLSYLRNNCGVAQYDDLLAILSNHFSFRSREEGGQVNFNSIYDDVDIAILATMIYAFEGEPLSSFLSWMSDEYFQRSFAPAFNYACERGWIKAIRHLMELRGKGIKGVDNGVRFDAGSGLSSLTGKLREEHGEEFEKTLSFITEIVNMPNVDFNGRYRGKTAIELAVSMDNIELVKLILTNPRINVARALNLCKSNPDMRRLVREYKRWHPECQSIYTKGDILRAIIEYSKTKLMEFLNSAMGVINPNQIPPEPEVQDALNKRETAGSARFNENTKRQILDILYPKK